MKASLILLSFLLSFVCEGQGIPSTRGAAYYKAKGFQVFPEYGFAVKCPCVLEDISMQSPGNNDLAYGCTQNGPSTSTIFFTQIIVKRLPGGYAQASRARRAEAQEHLFSTIGGTRITFLGQAATLKNYTSKGVAGRAIAFIKGNTLYTFNMMTNVDLDSRFNSLSNNIKFY